MLVKLEASDIALYWTLIVKTAREALPDHLFLDARKEDFVSDALLTGKMTAWIALDPDTQRPALCGLTTIMEDEILKIRNLELTALARVTRKPIPDEVWKGALRELLDYMRENGLHKMIAITREERILEMAEALGFRTDYSFLTLDAANLREGAALNGRRK